MRNIPLVPDSLLHYYTKLKRDGRKKFGCDSQRYLGASLLLKSMGVRCLNTFVNRTFWDNFSKSLHMPVELHQCKTSGALRWISSMICLTKKKLSQMYFCSHDRNNGHEANPLRKCFKCCRLYFGISTAIHSHFLFEGFSWQLYFQLLLTALFLLLKCPQAPVRSRVPY